MSNRAPKVVTPKQCPFTDEEIASALKDAESVTRWYTTQEVLDHLEWDHEGEDPDYVESYATKDAICSSRAA
jgi:hypothetical protein